MVHDIEVIRRTFVQRLKDAARDADFPEWGLGAHLAKIAGKTPKAVSKWLNCESMPDRIAMLKLADAMGVRVEWLEYGEEPKRGQFEAADTGGAHAMDSAPVAGKASTAADLVRAMLATKAGKGLPQEAQSRLLAAADTPQESSSEKPSNVIPADFSRNQARKGELLIPEFDIRAAMGAGQLPGDYVETVRNLVVNEAHLRAHGVNYSAPEHLAMITGWGDSMTPTINDKDPVMVDRGVNEFIGEGIYVLTWHKHLFIKRVQLLDAEHFNLISDNDRYPNQTAKIEDVIVHAKVLLIWNARKG
ncbi:LexA family transcriptional regulator [Metapseudomonas furukawaii]|uniref:LexA family transcriptional regulator n=1 Tax=Metapseudomonas furukawaii TaxID=1149133 RepID=UPI00227CD59B|nr:LexA family transcriptional regulator [Pseudomonas furukawaii]WAG76999.1 LexA family transcriptional regulator [Pseudomonas furukawaii]